MDNDRKRNSVDVITTFLFDTNRNSTNSTMEKFGRCFFAQEKSQSHKCLVFSAQLPRDTHTHTHTLNRLNIFLFIDNRLVQLLFSFSVLPIFRIIVVRVIHFCTFSQNEKFFANFFFFYFFLPLDLAVCACVLATIKSNVD